MSDRFERDLCDHLDREARQVSRFPEPLRARIQDAVEPRRGFGMMQQLALAGALVLFLGLLAFGVMQLRGFQGLNPVPAASGSPVVTPTVLPSASPTASAKSFRCGEIDGGDSVPGDLVRVQIAHHPGYDRIVFAFSDTSKIPTYRIVPQDSAHFVRDPSGLPNNLDGSAGLRIVFSNVSAQTLNAGGPATWKQTAGGAAVVTGVAELGDFERVVSFGVGLSRASCLDVFTLESPGRLVIDLQTP